MHLSQRRRRHVLTPRTTLALEVLENRCLLTTLFDNGSLVVKAELSPSVQEAPVPLSLNGVAVGNYQVLEFYHVVEGTNSLALDAIDTISNSSVQLACRKPDDT